MYTAVVVLIGILVSGPLLGPAATQAQNQGVRRESLTGQVVDAESGDLLIGATGALRKYAEEDSTLVTRTVTDSGGAFDFDDLPLNAYTLRVSYVGYASVRRSNTRPAVEEGEGDLGTLALSPQTTRDGGREFLLDRHADAARMSGSGREAVDII